jgi:hypothetical protein
MVEIIKEEVDKVISKVYRDALIKQSKHNFITLRYKPDHFPRNMQIVLDKVLGFLPNTNHLGKPFIMSVSVNKGTKEIEIIVQNPNF